MHKLILLFSFLFVGISGIYAQFDEGTSKIELYDMASDMNVYGYMLVKDKLYLINNIEKDDAAQEFDFAMAKIEENLSTIDMEETNPKVKEKLRNLKSFWYKFNQNVTQKMNNKDFRSVSYDVNNWDRLTSDLLEAMKAQYDLPLEKLQGYNDIQYFRKLIQKISMSYLANYLKLSKNFSHEYQNNIQEADAFIKEKTGDLLNDPVTGNIITDLIVDWNFLRANLLHPTQKNPKTIFALSVSIDYHLRMIKERLIQKMVDTF